MDKTNVTASEYLNESWHKYSDLQPNRGDIIITSKEKVGWYDDTDEVVRDCLNPTIYFKIKENDYWCLFEDLKPYEFF